MDTLPLELRVQIASLLNRASDLHALTLTCHSLRTAATPSLYKCFYYQNRENPYERHNYIRLNHGSQYVRTFRYCRRQKRGQVRIFDWDWKRQQNSRIIENEDRAVMCELQPIPSGNSTSFICDAEITIEVNTLLALLHDQGSSLEHSSSGCVTGSDLLIRKDNLPILSSLKTLGIPYMETKNLTTMRRLISNCPHLRRVTMCWPRGSKHFGDDDRIEPVLFLDDLFPPTHGLVSLEHSAIDDCNPSTLEQHLTDVVDVSKLVTLHLGYNLRNTLWLSTEAFQQTKPALRGLVFKLHSREVSRDSERFLRCFEGLRYAIFINTNDFSYRIDLDCLSRHAPTLERLLVGSSGYGNAHPEWFATLLGKGSKLRELGMKMPTAFEFKVSNGGYCPDGFRIERITTAPCSESLSLCGGEIPVDVPMLPDSVLNLPRMQQTGVSPKLHSAAAYVTDVYRKYARTGERAGEYFPVVGFRLEKNARSLLDCGGDMWYFMPQAHVDDDGAPLTVAVPIRGSDSRAMRPELHLFDSDEELSPSGRLPAYFDWFDYPAWSSDGNS